MRPTPGQRDRCLNCNSVIEWVNFSMHPRWMHVDPSSSFPSQAKGTAWTHCKQNVATPEPLLRDEDSREDAG